MSRGCLIPLAFVAAFLAGYVLCFATYVSATMLGFHDREGAMGMGVAFTIGPFIGLISGVVAAIWAARR